MQKNFTNRLINETSPYLLQHAHNPVDWHAWNDETLDKARSTGKMMLVSIGYSSCHWCHVMERESFEDESIAKLMNENFICVKVDREERPDVDQVYMNAVQLITGSGGWPLNAFTMPDGKPFFGGTYFRKEQWRELLQNIALLYETRQEDLEAQAGELTKGVVESELISPVKEEAEISREDISMMAKKMKSSFDTVNGGSLGAPKFPLPNNYRFLLNYYFHEKDEEVLGHIKLTLRKMAFGGIYDQVGGGFARYSVDTKWKVPHFEKMLYDNAQLVTLYSEAYLATGESLFKQTIKETLRFINREMTHSSGGFYSALDADSEGEEGKYYTWKESEIDQLLPDKSDILKRFYQVGREGEWENGKNILLRSSTEDEFAAGMGMEKASFSKFMKDSKKALLKERSKRVRPGLDDKILASWNALMLKGYLKGYQALEEEKYLESALNSYSFLSEELEREDGGLHHAWKDGKASINGFLEDYCFYIDALIELYQVTFDENYLHKAILFTEYAIENFYSEENGLFYFTSKKDRELIARKTELHDTVIPSSNSAMANVLYKLGHLADKPGYIDISKLMYRTVRKDMLKYSSAYTNWGILGIRLSRNHYNVAITGKEFKALASGIRKQYLPNILLTASGKESDLPLLKGRMDSEKSRIFVCTGKSCKLPVENIRDALNMIKS